MNETEVNERKKAVKETGHKIIKFSDLVTLVWGRMKYTIEKTM